MAPFPFGGTTKNQIILPTKMASLADDNNSGSDNDEVLDLSNGAILDKYKCAAEIVNKTLQGVIDTQLKDGASGKI